MLISVVIAIPGISVHVYISAGEFTDRNMDGHMFSVAEGRIPSQFKKLDSLQIKVCAESKNWVFIQQVRISQTAALSEEYLLGHFSNFNICPRYVGLERTTQKKLVPEPYTARSKP